MVITGPLGCLHVLGVFVNQTEPYFKRFVEECTYGLGENERGKVQQNIPENSHYVKSEDIMYEIKKIQQEIILREGYIYEHAKKGYNKEQLEILKHS